MSTQAAKDFLKNADSEFAAKVAGSDDAVAVLVEAGNGSFNADDVRAACVELGKELSDAELDGVAGGVPSTAPLGNVQVPGSSPVAIPGSAPLGQIVRLVNPGP